MRDTVVVVEPDTVVVALREEETELVPLPVEVELREEDALRLVVGVARILGELLALPEVDRVLRTVGLPDVEPVSVELPDALRDSAGDPDPVEELLWDTEGRADVVPVRLGPRLQVADPVVDPLAVARRDPVPVVLAVLLREAGPTCVRVVVDEALCVSRPETVVVRVADCVEDCEGLAVPVREALEDLVKMLELVGVQLRPAVGELEDVEEVERVRREEWLALGELVVVREGAAEIDAVVDAVCERVAPVLRVVVEEPLEERDAFVEAVADTVELADFVSRALTVAVRDEVAVRDTLELDVTVRVLVTDRESSVELVGVFDAAAVRVELVEINADRLGKAVAVPAAEAADVLVPVAVRVAERLAVAVSVGRIGLT